jgi:hypothetical protein
LRKPGFLPGRIQPVTGLFPYQTAEEPSFLADFVMYVLFQRVASHGNTMTADSYYNHRNNR